jgi:hypothetical protein
MGMNTATAPVELMKADSPAAAPIIRISSRFGSSPPRSAIQPPTAAATPVRDRPAPTMNSAAISTVTDAPNPASASSGVRIPLSASAMTAISATTSMRRRSLTNRAMTVARIAAVIVASVIPALLRGAVRCAAIGARLDRFFNEERRSGRRVVPTPRLERGTPRSTIWCSNQLSYVGTRRVG